MRLVIDPAGRVRALYDEALDLGALGVLSIRRASRVEPDETGRWWSDLAPVGGPRLGPFARRSEALAAEVHWLEHHLADLIPPSGLGAVSPAQAVVAPRA